MENLLTKSLFEASKLIIISRGSEKLINLVTEILEKKIVDTKIIIKCSNLDKKSKLRNLFEKEKNVILSVIDEGEGFKENDTNKIFKRFYSNRPNKFGEHSGLGLNIVKNLVELHNGKISASNNVGQKGAIIEIIFPKV